ncbi:MAG: polysaccharide pyruvyl transferase family protein [Candidatus Omnitrophica bacterium]|nr:polysaccharide pyruvyl transferase family protein [Candidatus Omnitrophota bacterium]MDD5429604.1 polysaccharide pyruvyl transferase family protein [Candidatus Omnitrophota bacterium]
MNFESKRARKKAIIDRASCKRIKLDRRQISAMKIGILTVDLSFNYGGILQAYALQTYLKKNGHEAWMIIRDKSRQSLGFSAILKTSVNRLFGERPPSAWDNFNKEFICQNTNYFIRKYINPITFTVENSNSMSWLDSYNFDAYIVGSDQVWRKTFGKNKGGFFRDSFESVFWSRPMFLDFVKSNKAKRIAYAASFGIDKWAYGRRSTKIITNLLHKFDAVSVREDCGVGICKKYLGIEPKQVIDPTMLLSSSEYMELCEKEKTSPNKGNVMVYFLDKTKEKIAAAVVCKNNLIPFFVKDKTKSVKTLFEGKVYPPVTDWIRAFFDAKLILTDSFHGCVFSILFNKPFFVMENAISGPARIHSLLKMFGLEGRLIRGLNELTNSKLQERVDFGKVNKILKIKQKEAALFLQKVLK